MIVLICCWYFIIYFWFIYNFGLLFPFPRWLLIVDCGICWFTTTYVLFLFVHFICWRVVLPLFPSTIPTDILRSHIVVVTVHTFGFYRFHHHSPRPLLTGPEPHGVLHFDFSTDIPTFWFYVIVFTLPHLFLVWFEGLFHHYFLLFTTPVDLVLVLLIVDCSGDSQLMTVVVLLLDYHSTTTVPDTVVLPYIHIFYFPVDLFWFLHFLRTIPTFLLHTLGICSWGPTHCSIPTVFWYIHYFSYHSGIRSPFDSTVVVVVVGMVLTDYIVVFNLIYCGCVRHWLIFGPITFWTYCDCYWWSVVTVLCVGITYRHIIIQYYNSLFHCPPRRLLLVIGILFRRKESSVIVITWLVVQCIDWYSHSHPQPCYYYSLKLFLLLL